MSRVKPQLDKLEDLFGTISGLTGIIKDDLCRNDCEGETPTLSNHHIGCLLSAIDELANRGYCALDAADRASQDQEART
ncbi:hypothetical protein QC823_15835 [Halomonas vilamensis]|uniref:Uncharacterized protein n=1 Tax=Vreelandella vilamensis TaxID=531309 RepID=A0ABU1H809_9GAMM|nr:hypothetical protein [Halomonas vilamensis]MDR5900434.1 hypothetical protein [Halomonas vilamensis]